MTPQRWQEITAIFHDALERDVAERDAFLEAACRHDPSLRSDVDSMLAAHRDAGSFGDQPLRLPVPESKRLQPGTLINSFRIDALIGAGGMGEVYRATDTRLGRSVAIKVLPDALARDSERLARLGREARVLATLNHPHIAAIYGIEEAGEMRALVLELVEGTTLADAIGRRALLDWRDHGDRAPDRGSARGGAREGHRAPRSQAGQHRNHTEPGGEGPRFRIGQSRGHERSGSPGSRQRTWPPPAKA